MLTLLIFLREVVTFKRTFHDKILPVFVKPIFPQKPHSHWVRTHSRCDEKGNNEKKDEINMPKVLTLGWVVLHYFAHIMPNTILGTKCWGSHSVRYGFLDTNLSVTVT